MKTTKKLLAIYDAALKSPKNRLTYYTPEEYINDCKSFIKDIKKRQTVCSIKPSQSGLSRKFNFVRYNCLLNLLYNDKIGKWDFVKVDGCGMNMHWALQYHACECICTLKEIEKYNLNMLCSSGRTL